jgi:hypothetical protein
MIPRLAKIAKRHADKSGEELEALAAEKREERRAFSREHRGWFPEDAHARFDELIAEAQAALERGLSAQRRAV